MRLTFQVFPWTEERKFTCVNCGKPNRKKKFTEEFTLNPFNTEASTPQEVRQQSRRAALLRAQVFMAEAWCATCESALSGSEQRELRNRRAAIVEGGK